MTTACKLQHPEHLNMRFLIAVVLLIVTSLQCSAIGVGFKINGKPESILVIGELSNIASSVQITNILQQLNVLKNLYTKLHDGEVVNLRIGRKLKHSKFLNLYEIESRELLKFISYRIKVNVGTNFSIQTYLTIYNTPSLVVSNSEPSVFELPVILDDSVLIELNEMFPENLEVTYTSTPSLEYDDVYGPGDHITSGLLRPQIHNNNCVQKCCNIM